MVPDTIVIHCSDSPQGRGDTAATIHRWHKERGFDGIGYHSVILEDGTLEYGRPEYWPGAHATRVNDHSLGVCLIGIDSFTERQYETLATYLHNKTAEYNISSSNIVGHYEVSTKTCPNFNVEDFKIAYNII
jgi:N-acetylmuramoyl-L-alanine amidase